VEIQLVLDGKAWLSTPIVRTLSSQKHPFKIIANENPDNNFARLWNLALKEIRSGPVLFIWPGCLPEPTVLNHPPTPGSFVSFVNLDSFSTSNVNPDLVLSQLHHILQCENIFTIQNTLFDRSIFSSIGEFDESPLTGKDCSWELFLRAEEYNIPIRLISGKICPTRWELADFPLKRVQRIPGRVSHFYNIKASREIQKGDAFLESFFSDLPGPEKRQCLPLAGNHPLQKEGQPPIKIAVISGIYDYVHDQLCFYNYFDLLFGQGKFLYVPFLDIHVQGQRDLSEMDVVIISRGRETNLYPVLKYCKENTIPTIYMVDDNWFWVSKDWKKDYGKMFSVKSTSYQVFTTCLRECDTVLVYNKMMAEDVSQFAKKTIQLPVNIQVSHFRKNITSPDLKKIVTDILDWRKETNGLVIGYAGSLRYNDVAFEALNEAIKASPRPVKALLFGHFTQKQLGIFKNVDPLLIPYTNYQNYASFLGNLKPDLLLAPLDKNRTSMSKAPNKYLEYSAVGAAGIYSNIPPYSDVVRSGENGVLVEDRVEAWEEAILDLILQPIKMRRIAENARKDVIKNYSTSKISKQFINMIKSVAYEE
jgi:glycosyltransferase involved in cell wall biosynthesis